MRTENEIREEINRLDLQLDKALNSNDLDAATRLLSRRWSLKWVLEEDK